jgi:hypothetical protein
MAGDALVAIKLLNGNKSFPIRLQAFKLGKFC